MSNIALQQNVFDIVEEYNIKLNELESSIKTFNNAVSDLEMSATIRGTYVGNVVQPKPYLHLSSLQKNLLMSGWKAVYNYLNIDNVATATDKKLFERTLQNPPELTVDNAKATFGDYILRPRFHKLRGLAEVFSSLDPAYKSHSKVKIGVKGLPKRVIISNVGSYGSYGQQKIIDIINALASYRNDILYVHGELDGLNNNNNIDLDGNHGKFYKDDTNVPNRDISIKTFANGNAHIIFKESALLDINRALAEFYGDALPEDDIEVTKKTN